MRIAIDASPLGKSKGGVARYTYNLAKHLPVVGPENKYFLFSNRDFDDAGLRGANVEKVVAKFPVMSVWLQTVILYHLKKLKIDLFHGTYFVIPILAPTPAVVSVHDLTPFIYKDSHQKSNLLVRTLFPPSLARAKIAITGSRSAADDLKKYLRCGESKIRIVPYAAAETFGPRTDAKYVYRIMNKYGIPSRYLLFVGTVEPRKNITSLIRAFALLKKNGDVEQKLVIAGHKTDYYRQCEILIRHLNLNGEIIFTGFVDEEDLPYIYSGANLFVYPSCYEGFGLPPLEAMACGVPTIVSEGSSFPEVVGDGALMVPAEDDSKLSMAMRKVLSEDGLRRELRAKGLERAKFFSWRKTALETLSIYREIVEGKAEEG